MKNAIILRKRQSIIQIKIILLIAAFIFCSIPASFTQDLAGIYKIVNTYPGEWYGALLSWDRVSGSHPMASVEKSDPVDWVFCPVPREPNTYYIINTYPGEWFGAQLSQNIGSGSHPMASVRFDDPIKWGVYLIHGTPDTYKIINSSNGNGASLSWDRGSGSHPMASVEQDDPVGWKLNPVGTNGSVKVNGHGQTVTEVSMGNIETTTKGGKFLEYTINNLQPINLGKNRVASIKLRPKASVVNGLLYIHLTTEQSTLDIRNYSNKWNDQQYYFDFAETSLSIADQPDKFEVDRTGPTNLNEEGTYTDMQSFKVGLDGKNPSLSYTMGSSTTRTVKDINFVNHKFGNSTSFTWTLSPTALEGMIGWEASQIASLKSPPTIATSSFPLYCQVLFKAKQQNDIPDFVTIRLTLHTRFMRSHLISNQDSDVAAFFEGFGFLVNPKTYKGELVYRIGKEPLNYMNFVDVTLDLRGLK